MSMPEDKAETKPVDDKAGGSDSYAEGSAAKKGNQTVKAPKGARKPPGESKLASGAASADKAGNAQPKKQKPQTRRLLKSVGMAMPSNRMRVFLGTNSIPPLSEKKHFVAKLRKLDRIDITILEGNDEAADSNFVIGELGLTNVMLREDGRAEIEIDFTIGETGYLTVTIADRLRGTESIGRFVLPQYTGEIQSMDDLGRLPVKELAEKIDLFEQQMQLLKGELTVRREREK